MESTLLKKVLKPQGVILSKKRLAPLIWVLVVSAPTTTINCQPGQFVMVISHKDAKPVPLTIADFDRESETITLVVQAVKKYSTKLLTLDVGEKFFALQGPRGHASEIKKYDGTIICVAGGVGIAPMFPVVRALKEAGNNILLLAGAREEKFLFWEEKISPYADGKFVFIERGEIKIGRGRGFTTPWLDNFLEDGKSSLSHVFAAGPIPMLKAVAEITKKHGVPNISSAVAQMIDGTGMCGGCQCNIGDKKILLCQQGPEIDGNAADWETLSKRLNGCRAEENAAFEEYKPTEEYAKFLAMEAEAEKGGTL